MINYFQSLRLAERAGVPPEIIEKDYCIELLLFYLANNNRLRENFIFRGGTALKKIYFPDYRFSEDMDFLVKEEENFNGYQRSLIKTIEKINVEYPFNLKQRFESEEERLQFFIAYNIIPEIIASKELKLDVLKDNYVPPTVEKQVLFSYQEFKSEKTKLKVYQLESVAVDKISRILDVDNEPRDLYDL